MELLVALVIFAGTSFIGSHKHMPTRSHCRRWQFLLLLNRKVLKFVAALPVLKSGIIVILVTTNCMLAGLAADVSSGISTNTCHYGYDD